MKEWFAKRKAIIFTVGVAYILLALFVVTAYVRTSLDVSAAGEDLSVLEIFFKTIINNMGDIPNNIGTAFGNFGMYMSSLKTFSIAYLIIGIVLIVMYKPGSEYQDIEHGSAGWAENGEQYQVLSKTDGFILANKHYLPVIPKPPEAKNGNILVIGGSGSGKSASFAIPNALQMLGSYIFTDPKGELYDRTAGIFKKNGYNVHVINLADPKFSDGYNPLSHIRNTTDVDIITKIISKKDDKGGGNKGGDPFWDQTSEALLKSMIYYIMFNRPKTEHSLASCLSLVRLGGENEGEDLMNLFMDLPFDNPARRSFETIRLGSEKTFSNILVSLAAKLEAFDSEEIAALTSTNTIEFENLAKEKSVVYFITPESHSTYDFLMNIFFSQLFQRLYEFGDQNGGALPVPMFLILDEFANIGRIPNFERILSTCRSKKLHISIILQSLDQLEEIYDEKVTQNIKANCSTHLFLGSNAQKTLEEFSKQLGEKTISRDNVSRSTDGSNQTSGHSYSDQIMGRALLTPDELRRMSTQECIILVQGMRPIKAQKYWYFKMHPRYKEAAENEISHLTFGNQKRGEYVITNPYELINGSKDLDIPSFDDIWNTPSKSSEKQASADNVKSDDNTLGSIFDDNYKNTKTNANTSVSSNMSSASTVAGVGLNSMPASSLNSNADKKVVDDDYDLQAELEKRFDELFGSPKVKKNTYSE